MKRDDGYKCQKCGSKLKNKYINFSLCGKCLKEFEDTDPWIQKAKNKAKM